MKASPHIVMPVLAGILSISGFSATAAESTATCSIIRSHTPPAGGTLKALFEGDDGWLYGASEAGGSRFEGMLFKMTRDGSEFVLLHSFTRDGGNGFQPQGLIEGSDGLLYGTTKYGGLVGGLSERYGVPGFGNGVVFRTTKDGTGYEILHEFTGELGDGYSPWTGVVEGPDGALYGTTFHGARMLDGQLFPSRGTIYKINKDGSDYRVLHMSGSVPDDGGRPFADLLVASDGKIYGTMDGGGNTGPRNGTVFRINPDGTGYEILHNFPGRRGDGRMPRASLIEAEDGRLYGTTTAGGFMDAGTVFRMNKDGSGYEIVRLFSDRGDEHTMQQIDRFVDQTGFNEDLFFRKNGKISATGSGPTAIVQSTDGKLYGVAPYHGPIGWGSVYRMNSDGSEFEVINAFDLMNGEGTHPVSVLSVTREGTVYGATNDGGKADRGTIFMIQP